MFITILIIFSIEYLLFGIFLQRACWMWGEKTGINSKYQKNWEQCRVVLLPKITILKIHQKSVGDLKKVSCQKYNANKNFRWIPKMQKPGLLRIESYLDTIVGERNPFSSPDQLKRCGDYIAELFLKATSLNFTKPQLFCKF